MSIWYWWKCFLAVFWKKTLQSCPFFFMFKIVRLLLWFFGKKYKITDFLTFFSKYAIIMAFFGSVFDKKAQFSHSLFGQNMLKSRFFYFLPCSHHFHEFLQKAEKMGNYWVFLRIVIIPWQCFLDFFYDQNHSALMPLFSSEFVKHSICFTLL